MGRMFIYTGNPTTGMTDGTQVSNGKNPGDAGYAPIALGPFDVTQNQEAVGKLAVRALPGFKANADVTLTPLGGNPANISLAPDVSGNPGTWGSPGNPIVLSGVTDINTCFWIKAQGSPSEDPVNDVGIKLQLNALTVAK